MRFLLLGLFLICARFAPSDVCVNEKAIIHHTFDVLDTNEEIQLFENQGTLSGEFFTCFDGNYNSDIDQNYCEYGMSVHSPTCDPKTLKTSEVWLRPMGDEDTDFGWDWIFQSLNIILVGSEGSISVVNATDLTLEGFEWFTPLGIFEDIYESHGEEGYITYIAMVFDDYDVDQCLITLKVYINATLVLELEEIEIDYHWAIVLRSMIGIHPPYETPPEEVYFTGAWDHALDAGQIAELYALGPDRAADTTLVKCMTHAEVVSVSNFKGSATWAITAFVVVLVILGVILMGFIGATMYYFYRNKPTKHYKAIPME